MIADTTGHPVVPFKGKGKAPSESKTLSVGGLLGVHGLKALLAEREGGPAVEVVWKVEGLSDLLALTAALAAAGLLGRHVVISNSQGTLETVKPEWVELLEGHRVHVVHDSERPGRIGAERWARLLAPHCPVVRMIVLPYPLAEAHGADVRDYLHRDKHPLADLHALADAVPGGGRKPAAATPPAAAPAAGAGLFDAALAAAAADTAPGGKRPATPSVEADGHATVLRSLELVVLGEHADRNVRVFSGSRRKVSQIASLNGFSYRDLIQLCGHTAEAHVHEGREEVAGKRTFEEVRRAIAFEVGRGLPRRPPAPGPRVLGVQGRGADRQRPRGGPSGPRAEVPRGRGGAESDRRILRRPGRLARGRHAAARGGGRLVHFVSRRVGRSQPAGPLALKNPGVPGQEFPEIGVKPVEVVTEQDGLAH